MAKRNGGSQLFEVVKGLVPDVVVVNGTISKTDWQRLLQEKCDINERQARASVSSYFSQGWLGDSPLTPQSRVDVNSAWAAAEAKIDRRYDARSENGKKGGRGNRRT